MFRYDRAETCSECEYVEEFAQKSYVTETYSNKFRQTQNDAEICYKCIFLMISLLFLFIILVSIFVHCIQRILLWKQILYYTDDCQVMY